MKIENWKIERVKPYDKNPRKNDVAVDAVAKSLKEFGFRQPIVVDKDGVVIVGHTRLKAAVKLGMDTVPVHIADLDPVQAKAYRLIDNQTASIAEWDTSGLNLELGELKDLDFDLSGFGFDGDVLGLGGCEGMTDPDEVPEPPKVAKTKPGDLYILGNHRLLCGDSTNADDVERLMDGHEAALCFTSPPYNAGSNSLGGNKNRVDSKYLNDDDDRPQDEYRQFLERFTAIALKTCRTVAVNLQSLAGNKVAILEWMYNFRTHFVDRLVWYKGLGQPAIAANVMNSRFEDVWILSPEENPKRSIPTGKFQSTVPNVYEGRGASGENTEKAVHAATMPMHFAVHCLQSFDGTGGVVYEPFCGSGTTVIAAEKLKRRCFGMELDPIYCDVAVKRWEEFTGEKAELLEASNG